MNRLCWVLAVLALSGCTTIDDFRMLSADQRAAAVCKRDREIRQLRRSQQTYLDGIQSAREALGRGYRVHKSCEQIERPAGRQTTCDHSGTQRVCKETLLTKSETRCQETPVAINADNERQNVQEWSQAAASIDLQIQAAYAQCYARVLPLTPEQAFQLY
jgi:hypothetical protein